MSPRLERAGLRFGARRREIGPGAVTAARGAAFILRLLRRRRGGMGLP